MAQGEATKTVEVQLVNVYAEQDKAPERATERVSADLASLFSYSYQWARAAKRSDPCTLTFSSMLAAMTASERPLCRWLQRHLQLRGVASETMTAGRHYARIELPELHTSPSFRTAFEEARRLCAEASPGQAIDVRHYMAAYAVCPNYHLADFLRYRIDRRAWCLELSEQLAMAYPEERSAWLGYAKLATPVPVLAFNTDAPEGRDLLNIDREVEAFARLTAARTTITPLSIGVFGAWGSGKSFFMRRVRERVAQLAETGREEGRSSAFHGQVAQIEFNAWHYSEGSLIACLVDHIFRNLRIGVEDEDDAALRRRSTELILQIDRAKQGLADREHEIEEAETRRTAAQRAIEEIDAKVPAQIATKQRELEAATAALVVAQGELAQVRERKQAAVDQAIANAPKHAAIAIVDPRIEPALKQLGEMVNRAKKVTTRWLPILLGLVLLIIGLGAAYLWGLNAKAQVVTGVAALTTYAAAGRTWLVKLNDIAKRGQEFQTIQAQVAKEAVDAVEAAHKPTLDAAIATEQTRQEAVNAARKELDQLAAAAGVASEELRKLEQQRAIALDQRAQATAELAARTEALAALSTGSLLGEFLDERAATDGYRKQLTLFTQVRNDFERLSKLMARATAEYFGRDKPAPTVSRIVLYIDDLDRCPPDKVVEVLRTVHLMLAFPLFVCFVAVDPRWVTECLRRAPGLVDHDHADNGPEPVATRARASRKRLAARHLEEEFGKPATAADYLEKIFQIPLWLRPVPAGQRPAIVRALMDPSGARSEARIEAPVVVYEAMAVASAPGAPAPAKLELAAGGPVKVAALAPSRAARPAAPPMVDLEIDAVELDYLDQLGGLLDGNPRALKRFVNTYRLVKSALSDVELQVFRSPLALLGGRGENRPRYLPYRMCMAQLAVVCTQRERALEMVRLADRTPEDSKLGPWLDELAKTVDEELARCFREALTHEMGDVDLGQVEISTFKLWLERTRRYSFYL